MIPTGDFFPLFFVSLGSGLHTFSTSAPPSCIAAFAMPSITLTLSREHSSSKKICYARHHPMCRYKRGIYAAVGTAEWRWRKDGEQPCGYRFWRWDHGSQNTPGANKRHARYPQSPVYVGLCVSQSTVSQTNSAVLNSRALRLTTRHTKHFGTSTVFGSFVNYHSSGVCHYYAIDP